MIRIAFKKNGTKVTRIINTSSDLDLVYYYDNPNIEPGFYFMAISNENLETNYIKPEWILAIRELKDE